MKKKLELFLFILTVLLVFSFFISNVFCESKRVIVEFLYFKPCCSTVYHAAYDAYLYNRMVIEEIQRDYNESVIVNWIPFYSPEGLERRKQFSLSDTDWNSVIINHEVVLVGGENRINRTYLLEVLSFYIGKVRSEDSTLWLMSIAFSLGFFESFSPCVIIMLSFIVSYTLASKVEFREGFARITLFGMGFVSATVIIGLTFGLFLFFASDVQPFLMWVVFFFAIISGLNLLGLLKIPIETKPLITKIANRHVYTYIGVFLLGFIFYFLDPCIAPVFASTVAILSPRFLWVGLTIFCLGTIIPFIGIGLFTCSISKLTRKVYKYRHLFRGISGVILIGYAFYILIYMLL